MSSFDGVKLRYKNGGCLQEEAGWPDGSLELVLDKKEKYPCNTIFFSTCQKVGSLSGPGISPDRLRILQSQLSSNVDLLMPLQAIEGLPRGVWVPICHSISEKC